MAIHFHQNAVILYDGYDLSGDSNEVSIEHGVEPLDVTVFGNDTRTMKAGLLTANSTVNGFWDSDATGKPDDVFFPDIGSATTGSDRVFSVFPEGAADGARGFSYKTMRAAYSPSGTVGEMFTFTANGPAAKSRLMQTTVLTNSTETSTSTGTARQVGAVTATDNLYAVLHVTNSGGDSSQTLDVTIESDNAEGFPSAQTQITFAQVTTSVIGVYATPITTAIPDDWWRAAWTIGGTGSPTFTFVVGISILPKL